MNVPAKFVSIMDDIFRDFVDKFVIVHLDDILIDSRTYEALLDHLQNV